MVVLSFGRFSFWCSRTHRSHREAIGAVFVACHALPSRHDRQPQDLLDIESGSVSFIVFGIPNARFGISSKTKTTVHTYIHGIWRLDPAAPQTADRSRATADKETLPACLPAKDRWSALNLKQKRRKLERQGPSITAWIPCIICSKYPQWKCYSCGHGSDACMDRKNGKEEQPRQGGGGPRTAALATALHWRTYH